MTFGPTFDTVLAAAQSGAPWALERLYAELAPAVAGYFRVQGMLEADDLTSDVFLKVLGGIPRFSGGEPQFRSWVFTVAHHRLVDERRRLARRPHVDDADLDELPASPGAEVEDDALRRLSGQRVRRLCDRLAADQRDVLLLRLVTDMSLEQNRRPGRWESLSVR